MVRMNSYFGGMGHLFMEASPTGQARLLGQP